jgi:hypothetical protein
MAMTAVAASKDELVVVFVPERRLCPWRSVPWLHQRSLVVSTLASAVACVHGDYCRGCIKGAARPDSEPRKALRVQSTKYEFVINLQAARAIQVEVPNAVQLLADELIE